MHDLIMCHVCSYILCSIFSNYCACVVRIWSCIDFFFLLRVTRMPYYLDFILLVFSRVVSVNAFCLIVYFISVVVMIIIVHALYLVYGHVLIFFFVTQGSQKRREPAAQLLHMD